MQVLSNLIVGVQVASAVAMIVLVLIQHGKGADMGASFGSGSAGSLFGATGSANFLSRMTAVAATLFFSCTLALAYLSVQKHTQGLEPSSSVLDRAAAAPVAVPASGVASAPVAASGVALPASGAKAASPSAPAVPSK